MHEKSVRKLSPAAKKRLGKQSKRKAKRRGRKPADEEKPKRKARKARKARQASPAAHLKAIQGGVKLRKVSDEEKRYSQDRD